MVQVQGQGGQVSLGVCDGRVVVWCCGRLLEVLVGDAVQVSITSVSPVPINLLAHKAEVDMGWLKALVGCTNNSMVMHPCDWHT